MSLFQQLFTWWNGATIGTRIHTARAGALVGTDEQGNAYYQSAGGDRRWVIYNGEAEASRVSPDWHGWLHHTFDAPPSEQPLPRQSWEKPHQPNMTGSDGAYRPAGSLASSAERAPATGDYQAWSPDQ